MTWGWLQALTLAVPRQAVDWWSLGILLSRAADRASPFTLEEARKEHAGRGVSVSRAGNRAAEEPGQGWEERGCSCPDAPNPPRRILKCPLLPPRIGTVAGPTAATCKDPRVTGCRTPGAQEVKDHLLPGEAPGSPP